MSEREEVLLERTFVLHHRDYRNTSMLLDCITLNHGRVSLVSQGARRARGGQRALLQPFGLLRISWVRRGELGRLTHVEAGEPPCGLGGDALLAGYYLNELLIRLVERGDSNPALFEIYASSLAALATGTGIARSVRLFERDLLETLGYHIDLHVDRRSGEGIEPDADYVLEHEEGLTLARPDQRDSSYRGTDLISLRDGKLDDAASLRTAKVLLGRVLAAYVGERPLRSRDVMQQVVDRRRAGTSETTD